MLDKTLGQKMRIVFVPRHMHARMAIHSLATATGAAVAFRMEPATWWIGLGWYAAAFVGAHAVMMPFMAAWYWARNRVERWVRSLVEEELIRFDLQTYERQLHRVFPARKNASDDEVRS